MSATSSTSHVRPAAVAGRFYPGDHATLRAMVRVMLDEVKHDTHTASSPVSAPKAIIAPHAGYMYSGPVAASAYARIRPLHGIVERVVLIGPSHRVAFRGLATSGAAAFATPLGHVPLDRQAIATVEQLPHVRVFDEAHALEHGLEVHLPFLQEILGRFTLVPLVVGEATGEDVARVLQALWGGRETLIVVSSDLSHYHAYDQAVAIDLATTRAVEALRPEDLSLDQACGCVAIQGLLTLAPQFALHARTVDQRNSADAGGPRSEVVGYGAYLFEHTNP